jgi:hypothetical protein
LNYSCKNTFRQVSFVFERHGLVKILCLRFQHASAWQPKINVEDSQGEPMKITAIELYHV